MGGASILGDYTVIDTARTHTTGGREGHSQSDAGQLEAKLDRPGSPGNGTNPEQLFAAGWSARFEGAMAVVARNRGTRQSPN
jgi:osmotically inducible protein OsmC